MTLTPRDRLILALDLESPEEARAILQKVGDGVGMVKVGSQLFTSAGPDFVRELEAAGRKVFLDLKYHDIPNTVAAAVAQASRLGVAFLDVHALGGAAMIRAAAGALPAVGTRLLAITILTSHDEESLDTIGIEGSAAEAVGRLARQAKEAGADGVVCSPQEIALVRAACGSDFVIVTPGIRMAGADAGDQARPATPAAAIQAGADYLVVGRPILTAADPRAAADAIVGEMARALQA